MKFNELKSKVQNELANGEINIAIDLFLEYLRKTNKNKSFDQVLLLKTKWIKSVQDYTISGLITKDEYDISFNKTVYALQEIMNDVSRLYLKNDKNDNIQIDRNRPTVYLISIIVFFLFVMLIITLSPITVSEKKTVKTPLSTQEENPSSYDPKKSISKAQTNDIGQPNKFKPTVGLDKSNSKFFIKDKIGVNYFDEKGEYNNIITNEIIHTLKFEPLKLALADKYTILKYSRALNIRLFIQEKDSQTRFDLKLIHYDIKLIFQFVDMVRNKICIERNFYARVEANEYDTKEKIKRQGIYDILKKIELDSTFFECN